jgi:hypothetical protein
MKMNPQGDHLSDEQISDLLDGVLADDGPAVAHLSACTVCATKLGDLRAMHAGLRAMRDVGAMPDFRLGADGTPRSARATAGPRLPHPRARVPQMPRFLGGAVLLCGVLLLSVAFFSSFGHGVSMQTNDAAYQSVAAPCTNVHCPSAGMNPTPSNDVAGGASPQPKPTITPTVTPSTQIQGTTPAAAPSSQVIVEWSLGVVLTLGGIVVLARRRDGA